VGVGWGGGARIEKSATLSPVTCLVTQKTFGKRGKNKGRNHGIFIHHEVIRKNAWVNTAYLGGGTRMKSGGTVEVREESGGRCYLLWA